MTSSNDPQHEEKKSNLNEPEQSYHSDPQEINNSTVESNSDQEVEAERLWREERRVAKAQRLAISKKITQTVSYLVTALEILLGLRFLLMVTGANPDNLFSNFIYTLSKPFAIPFSNLFGTISFNNGANVLDVNILFGMIIYLLLMILVKWLIKLIIVP